MVAAAMEDGGSSMKKRRLAAPAAARKLVGDYERLGEIGRGTYGTVYLGEHRETRRRVALKKVLAPRAAAEREAALLARCRGAPNVLLEVVEHKDKVFLVLEYMASDVEAVISADEELPVAHVKALLQMLLRGVSALHERRVLHRDLKPNNLLLSPADGVAKITDLGMATLLEEEEEAAAAAAAGEADGEEKQARDAPKRSLQVVTRAYRDPQLFFGEEHYGREVDVWSVGCIFAELLLRRVFCDGASDIEQLSKVFSALGSPAENGWAGASDLPFFLRFKDTHPPPLSAQFPMLSPLGVDLLAKLLALDPRKRISAADALQHGFFREDPAPAPPGALRVPDASRAASAREQLAEEQRGSRGRGGGEQGGGDRSVAIKGRRLSPQ